MVVLSPPEEVAKPLPVARLATHKLLVSVDAIVGLELFATTLEDKHMPSLVLVRSWQRLESLVTDMPGVNSVYLLCFVPPTLNPSSNNMNSLTNQPSTLAGSVASR